MRRYGVQRLCGRVERASPYEHDVLPASAALPTFGLARETVRKMRALPTVRPGYRQDAGRSGRPKLDAFTGIIDQILRATVASACVS